MISKILAGIVLWIFVSFVIATFAKNPGDSFLESFVAVNILMLTGSIIVVLIDLVREILTAI